METLKRGIVSRSLLYKCTIKIQHLRENRNKKLCPKRCHGRRQIRKFVPQKMNFCHNLDEREIARRLKNIHIKRIYPPCGNRKSHEQRKEGCGRRDGLPGNRKYFVNSNIVRDITNN